MPTCKIFVKLQKPFQTRCEYINAMTLFLIILTRLNQLQEILLVSYTSSYHISWKLFDDRPCIYIAHQKTCCTTLRLLEQERTIQLQACGCFFLCWQLKNLPGWEKVIEKFWKTSLYIYINPYIYIINIYILYICETLVIKNE